MWCIFTLSAFGFLKIEEILRKVKFITGLSTKGRKLILKFYLKGILNLVITA